MEQYKEKFDLLIGRASRYLRNKLQYAKKTADNHERHWRYVGRALKKRKIKFYNKDIGLKVLRDRFGERILLRHEKEFYNSVYMLNEFLESGKITTFPRMERRYQNLSGKMANVICRFIDEKKGYRMSQSSIRYYTRNLFRFNEYCNSTNITCPEEINLNFIFSFIKNAVSEKGYPAIPILSTLRIFVKYLHDQQFIADDFSKEIPKYKAVLQPKIPSTYSDDEVKLLIQSMDRSTPIGKRDYTVVLIAARLGLRASDIANLQFENLHWDKSIIKFNQCKTGKELILPLLPDVGNAIIDYMKFGRSKSQDPHIFLCQRPPYGCFSNSNVVTHIVQRAFLRCGLASKNRKFGSHSLRHTLGFRMLQESTLLPVITEVLGHQSSKSTRYYLRIDLESMKQCMLDVPVVATSFYNQKGGVFYV